MNEIEKIKRHQDISHKLYKYIPTIEFLDALIDIDELDLSICENTLVFEPVLVEINEQIFHLKQKILKSYSELEYLCPCFDCTGLEPDIVQSQPYEVDISKIKFEITPHACGKCFEATKRTKSQFIQTCEAHHNYFEKLMEKDEQT